MSTTINNLVACTPFKKNYNEVVMKGGLALNKNASASGGTLEELTVLLDAHITNGEFEAFLRQGNKVYVKSDQYKQPWATTKFIMPNEVISSKEGDKIEFILVPHDQIIIKS